MARIGAQICQLVIDQVQPDAPVLVAAIEAVRGQNVTKELERSVQSVAVALDDAYLSLLDAERSSSEIPDATLAAFCKARAASAVVFLLQGSLVETVYEAIAAINDRQLIERIVIPDKQS